MMSVSMAESGICATISQQPTFLFFPRAAKVSPMPSTKPWRHLFRLLSKIVGGNVEAVKDGIIGFVVPPEDPGTLSSSHSSPTLRSNPGKDDRRSGKAAETNRFTSPPTRPPAIPFPITTNWSKREPFGYIVAQDVACRPSIASASH